MKSVVTPSVLAEPESPAVVEALRILAAAGGPDIHWLLGDNLCDCLFQRIGDWNNSYLGRTLRVRVCCIWAELYKQYPQFVQELPYYDSNRHTYNAEPQEWDSDEMPMPVYLWLRQLAIKHGKSLAQIREEYAGRDHERPKAVKVRKGKEPTKAELHHAHEAQLRASGWILPDERLSDDERKIVRG